MVHSGAVFWTSRKKTIVNSTMQSEYMALSDSSREAVTREQFFEELNIPSMAAIILSDNEAAIDLNVGLQQTTGDRSISTSDITSFVTLLKKGRWKSVVLPAGTKSLTSSRKHLVHNITNSLSNL
jgi:hypothetical protein